MKFVATLHGWRCDHGVLICWLFLSLALVAGAAQSQEKTPPKEERNTGALKPSKQQIGTDARPFIVTIKPTEGDKKDAQAREQERQDKKQSDADLVWWTSVLAGLAGLQFVALLLHAGIFAYQSRKLKETVGEMRREFISTHRPKLILREAYALQDNDGKQIIACYTIANIGNTAAQIVESALDIQFEGTRSSSLRLPPASVGRNDIGSVVLEAGAHHAGECKSSRTTVWPIPDGLHLFFTGHIVYLDERKVMRHIGIRRRYDPVDFRFYRGKDESEQLDYAD